MPATPNENLFLAAFNGNVTSVRALISTPGVNINWQESSGFTALAAASQEGHLAVISVLLTAKELDVNLPQADGASPLHLAVKHGHAGSVKALLADPRTDPNFKLRDVTPLYAAVHLQKKEIVGMLLQHPKILVNLPKENGLTPVFLTCQNNLLEILPLFLRDPRTDINILNCLSFSPFEVALFHCHLLIVQYLIACGRTLDTKKRAGIGFWANNSLELARLPSNSGSQEVDSEMQRKKLVAPHITQLVDLFEKEPVKARAQVRATLQVPETRLEEFLGIQLSFCAQVSPAHGTLVVDEVESLSLADSCISILPVKLSLFTNITELDLSSNPLGGVSTAFEKVTQATLGSLLKSSSSAVNSEQNGQLIAQILRNSPKLKHLNLLKTNLGSPGMVSVLQALVINFSLAHYVLKSLLVDDIKLTSFDGLHTIPIDILEMGSVKIVQYMLDLFSSPEAPPLYRSKLMVVGFENVGKTTILDCLFPLTGWAETMGKVKKTKYWCKLQGSIFSKYSNPKDEQPHKGRVVYIENRQWEVISLCPKVMGLRVFTKKKSPEKPDIELHFADQATHDVWFSRFKKVCMNEATHGIEIQTVSVKNDCTDEYFAAKKVADRGKGVLELSVWDFAGQHDYYNNHHHFLSARSVFLVLWKLSDPAGLKGLEFWLRSLATHLAPPSGAKPTGTYFSIFIVGTFLDHPSVKKEERNLRAEKVDQLAKECGLAFSEIQYFEVSCAASLENINIVHEVVTKTALSHSYMGERAPMKYLSISEYLTKTLELQRRKAASAAAESAKASPSLDKRTSSFIMQPEQQDLFSAAAEIPVMKVEELVGQFSDQGMVQRALSLLSLWGECIYFDSPPDLAALVVLDPKFLAKGILADLFASTETNKGLKKDGIMTNANLVHVWSRFKGKNTSAEDFAVLCRTFLTLLEKLDVCFVLGADHEMEFKNQRTVIPALLPDVPLRTLVGSHFSNHWPKDPPHNQPIQIERVLKFTVVPSELVSRLLVHLHDHIVENLVAKNEVLILVRALENTKGWIRVEENTNRFFIALRGSDVVECIKLLDYVVAQVREIAKKYKSVTWEEAVRSPYYSRAEIDLQAIVSDASRPLDQRELECPDTHVPLRAERLMLRAGLIEKFNPSRALSWWDWGSSGAGGKERQVVRLLGEMVKQSDRDPEMTIKDPALFEKFKMLFEYFGGKVEKVTKVYAIDNPRQRISFENYRKDLTEKHSDNEELFRREDWRAAHDADQKKTLVHLHNEKISKFRSLFNDGTKVHALPVVQGTSENAAFRIVKNGFGTVASVDDGYYGHGMYFTSNLKYASKYAHFTPHGKVFMIAMTIPGNAYPVTEPPTVELGSLMGQACRKGYQSHYVGVRADGHPAKKEGVARETEIYADELVVFEGWQTLPLFLVYTEQFGKSTGSSQDQPSTEKVPKGWGFLSQAVGNKEAVSTSQLEALKVVLDEEELETEDQGEEKMLLRRRIKALEDEVSSKLEQLRYVEERLKASDLEVIKSQEALRTRDQELYEMRTENQELKKALAELAKRSS